MPAALVGTASGLVWIDAGGGPRSQLDGHSVSALAPAGWTRVWAALDDHEIWRCDDPPRGEWSPIGSAADLAAGIHVTCLADTRANDPDGILAGTSGARLLRFSAGRLEPVAGFDSAPGRARWFTPWGGPPDTRSISEDRDAVFVNVHVGGVLRSRDAGATWEPTIDVNADVHRVVTGAGRIYAAGASGLSVSRDGGDTWRLFGHGLHARYCRSVALCGQALLLSASDGPGAGRAALYRSSLDGVEFERCRQGLPAWFDGNIDSLCLDALPDGGFTAFGTEAGDVFVSTDHGSTWTGVARGLAEIRCVLVLP
jgi:hypothetical protein